MQVPHLLGSFTRCDAAVPGATRIPFSHIHISQPTRLLQLSAAPSRGATQPVPGPPKAGVGEPAEKPECERKEAATPEASAPAPELVHPKGRPFSRRSSKLRRQHIAQTPTSQRPLRSQLRVPQEAPEELPGQAEALEALKALMAELGGMGFKVPKKPTGEPEAAGRAQGKLIKTGQISHAKSSSIGCTMLQGSPTQSCRVVFLLRFSFYMP